jgi:acyl transferase domain-containing protein
MSERGLDTEDVPRERQPAGGEDPRAVAHLRRALIDLGETRRRLDELERRLGEPIAVVGIGCRYPGGVRSPEDLWELVSQGRDAISGLPRTRGWELDALGGPDGGGPGGGYRGGFLHDAGEFDAEFFGIPEPEALLMDPQQRLLLETTWEACEDAAIAPTALAGSRTGVFFGVAGAQTYAGWLLGAKSECPEGYWSLGTAGGMMSGRVAHVLDLEGPAVTLDAACSSSAVALHLACQSLRAGECSLALAGGAAVMSVPWLYVLFSRQSLVAMAPDGRCKSFAGDADGAGFSEGVGVLLLERLADAERRGHEVLALLRASAVTQDGASNGLSSPNGLAHESAIRQALSGAGLSGRGVDVVEGHGMGTALGDAIEAQALLATYGREREPGRPLRLGSIKSNIGHSQAASGVAGVIKMAMAMRHGLLPRTLHAGTPSQHVDWSSGAVSLLTESLPWPRAGEPRRAAVHSFGISGTNVHLILEESPPAAARGGPESTRRAPSVDLGGAVPWLVSGRGPEGLRRQARGVAEFAAAHPDLDVGEIARSLALSRAALEHRAMVLGGERGQLREGMLSVAEGRAGEGIVEGVASSARRGVVFVFSGGGRWEEIAAPLLDSAPVFAAEIDRVGGALSSVAGWSPHEALRAAGTVSASPEQREALGFAVAVALVALWRACGVAPAAVVGLAQGELAAAHTAGAIALEDAVRLIGIGELPPAGDPRPFDVRIGDLRARGHGAFVEIGSPVVPEGLLGEAVVVQAAEPGLGYEGVLGSLGRLWVAGAGVDWRAALGGSPPRRVGLPTYAFDRRNHWVQRSPIWQTGGPMLAGDSC